MAKQTLRDENKQIVCQIDLENVMIEVKQRGERQPRRVSLIPYLKQLCEAAETAKSKAA